MKIQIDFDNKVISIESNVNLGEFFERIEKILPEWKEFELKTNTEIKWQAPVYIEPYQRPYEPFRITYDTGTIPIPSQGVTCFDLSPHDIKLAPNC